VGGLVSTNAGGVQVLRFGTMRTLVLGLEAVLPDGSLFDGLAPLAKDNRGYDIRQLLIGAEGTLGIVTAATLRLVPAIGSRAVAWAGVDSPHAALALLRRLQRASGDAIESFELVPATASLWCCSTSPAPAPARGSDAVECPDRGDRTGRRPRSGRAPDPRHHGRQSRKARSATP
jgi:FAD/FMN-containing dehydrogenase